MFNFQKFFFFLRSFKIAQQKADQRQATFLHRPNIKSQSPTRSRSLELPLPVSHATPFLSPNSHTRSFPLPRATYAELSPPQPTPTKFTFTPPSYTTFNDIIQTPFLLPDYLQNFTRLSLTIAPPPDPLLRTHPYSPPNNP